MIGKPLPSAEPGKPFGTPYYIAPEVLTGNYDEKCDMWSIGCILFTLLTGLPPFQGQDDAETLAKVAQGKYSTDILQEAEVSDECINFISKLLTKDPAKRISSEEALKDPFFVLHEELSKEVFDATEKALHAVQNFNKG